MRSEVLLAKSLPTPEASQQGAVSINTQTSPSCLLPVSYLCLYHWLGFPGGSGNPPANARDTRDAGLIPGSGGCPGIGTGNRIQYSCLKNSMDIFQALGPGALGKPRGSRWRGRWEGGSGWGTHVNPWLFHFNV